MSHFLSYVICKICGLSGKQIITAQCTQLFILQKKVDSIENDQVKINEIQTNSLIVSIYGENIDFLKVASSIITSGK